MGEFRHGLRDSRRFLKNYRGFVMSIQVRYFASLKELSGCDEQQLNPILPIDVKSVWSYAHPDHPLPSNTLAAVNMEYVSMETLVQDGDEVAFFPPVTGG